MNQISTRASHTAQKDRGQRRSRKFTGALIDRHMAADEDRGTVTAREQERRAMIIHASGTENLVEILFSRLPEYDFSSPFVIVRDKGSAVPAE